MKTARDAQCFARDPRGVRGSEETAAGAAGNVFILTPKRVSDHQTAATARPWDCPVPLARGSVLPRSREGEDS